MDYTDNHQRRMQNLISSDAVLYTEMITTNSLVHTNEPQKFLCENEKGHIVVQLGGSDPQQMFKASKIVQSYGYKEININCGCPSDRVAGKGAFGASLMKRSDIVSELALAVLESTGQSATIKCRIGVDNFDSYDFLTSFISEVADKGKVSHFIIHARKAILNANFSPADNRKIPPLRYDVVHQLVRDFPHLSFSINGGFKSYEDSLVHFEHGVSGVMVGRAVIDSPFYWKSVNSVFYNTSNTGTMTTESLCILLHHIVSYRITTVVSMWPFICGSMRVALRRHFVSVGHTPSQSHALMHFVIMLVMTVVFMAVVTFVLSLL